MIGVIGGTGFQSMFEKTKEMEIMTPYGKPSSKIISGKIGNKEMVLLFRHGIKHEYPPHKIPYKANIYALRQAGVDRIISISSVGSLKEGIAPGDFIIPDQMVEFTRRDDTFYHGPETMHLTFSDPYCQQMRKLLIENAREMKISLHDKGTAVIVNGPRFETRAEIDFYARNGWDILNMTQYPECVLAKEMEMCYANISLVTDYPPGVVPNPKMKPTKSEDIQRITREGEETIRNLIIKAVKKLTEPRTCECKDAMKGAKL